MKRKELQELLTLVSATGNADAIAKVQELLKNSANTVPDWNSATELVKNNKLTISRGNYDDAANMLVEYGNLVPERQDDILKILSKKIVSNGGNNE